MPDRAKLAVLTTLAAAVGLVGAWLAAPPLGTDLSAQVARADFFAAHGFAAIDFRWYGGVSPHGYSLVSPPLMAWLGPRPAGAVAAVIAALALVLLLVRTGAPRPLLGGVLGVVGIVGNLVSGRITFALGVALGLLALLALTPGRPPKPRAESGGPAAGKAPTGAPKSEVGADPGRPARRGGPAGPAVQAGGAGPGHRVAWWSGRAVRYAAAGLLAALAAATSPVAGLFVALAGTALALSTVLARRPRPEARAAAAAQTSRWRGGVVLVAGAAVPVAAMAALFGSGGAMNMSAADLTGAAGASLVVAALVPHRVVRIGALLSAVLVTAAYLLPTPVGLNAIRLAVMFSLPLVAAYAQVPTWVQRRWPRVAVSGPGAALPAGWLAVVLVGLALWQPPVIYRDLASAGDPTASPEYFAALQQELARREPAGRVEVVPTENYWESAYLDTAPLARGWLRQADIDRHPLFFDGTLDAGTYRQWLADNSVSYVAVAATPPSWVGRREAELIAAGLPYLTPVWRDSDWTLYRFDGARPLVAGPAVLQEATPQAVDRKSVV